MPDARHHRDAWHDYKVTNFSLLVGIGRNKYAASSTFSAGGCDWSIRFYPDADADAADDTPEEAASFTAVYLCLMAGPASTRVKFKFTLLDDKGRRVSARTGVPVKHGARTGSSTDDWSALEELLLRDSNDSFTIRCAMAVIRTRTVDDAVIEIPESALRRDLARMLRDGDGADVAFSVGDRFFRAHRYVLASRSMVFKAQLFGAMKEAQPQLQQQGGGAGGAPAPCVVIRVDDMDPAAFEGLVAADRYGLDRLRVICEARLCGWIDVQSVATTLALAERHQCAKLREACLRFLSWPEMLRAAMKTEGLDHLIASYPSVASDILHKVISARIDD